VSVYGTGTLLNFFIFALQGLAGGFTDVVEVSLVPIEDGEDAGIVAQGAEGEGGFEILAGAGLLAGDFGIEEIDLQGPEAEQAPAGGGEAVDEGEVAGGLGRELEEVALAEGAEFVLGLVGEDDSAGGEAVGEGGGLAAGAACGCDGTARACSVGAGRSDAALRRHWRGHPGVKVARPGRADGGWDLQVIEGLGDSGGGRWGMRARDSRRSKPLASNSAASRSASAWLRRRRGAALTCSSLIPLLNHEAHCAYRWFGLTDTAHKRSRLEFLGNCPYGYRLAADRKHIEPDRAEQAVLKRIR
jgi:hypothetical protein